MAGAHAVARIGLRFCDRLDNAIFHKLERRGLLEPAPPELHRPHTPEWFVSLRGWNPKQAAMTEAAIRTTGSLDVCSVCADDPARDYDLVSMPAAGPGTLRLCDDCFRIRSANEPMKPF